MLKYVILVIKFLRGKMIDNRGTVTQETCHMKVTLSHSVLLVCMGCLCTYVGL